MSGDTEMGDWQPIETAPTGRPLFGEDGPLIEVWFAGCDGYTLGYFGRGADPALGPRWSDRNGRALTSPSGWRYHSAEQGIHLPGDLTIPSIIPDPTDDMIAAGVDADHASRFVSTRERVAAVFKAMVRVAMAAQPEGE